MIIPKKESFDRVRNIYIIDQKNVINIEFIEIGKKL